MNDHTFSRISNSISTIQNCPFETSHKTPITSFIYNQLKAYTI